MIGTLTMLRRRTHLKALAALVGRIVNPPKGKNVVDMHARA